MKNSRIILITLLTLIFLFGVNSLSVIASNIILDQYDREVRIVENPTRIVSIAPSNTALLIELGLGERIVGVTNWCFFEEVEDVTRVGDIDPLNLELIVSLNPDLIVAHRLNGKEVVDRLTEFGFNVLAFNPNNLEALIESVEILGKVAGVEEKAAELVSEMRAKLGRAKEDGGKNKEKGLKVFYLMFDGEPLWTAGPGSFIHETIELAGGINIAGDQPFEWVQIDLEAIYEANPDIIIYGGDPEEIYNSKRWSPLAAAKKSQVYQLDMSVFEVATPAMFDEILKLVELLAGSK